MAQKMLAKGPDSEQALADALGTTLRKLQLDDDASETSSVCSERTLPYAVDDLQDIFNKMNSGQWADRKEGLLHLQACFKSGKILSRGEVKRITEIFTRMFNDPHSKVLVCFFDTLQEFLMNHSPDLHDWLNLTCVPRLMQKLGSEHPMQSMHSRVQKTIDVIQDSFPYALQFNILTRYVVDPTQSPNLKVRQAILCYMSNLAAVMDSADFINSSNTRLAISRIVTWSTEPKSVEIRKTSQSLLIALFNLNTPEFSLLLAALPKTFQDNATRILHNHVRTHSQSDSEPFSPLNTVTPRKLSASSRTPTYHYRSGPTETENMNPEDIDNSMKQTLADIHKWTNNVEDLKKETRSQDSGIQGSLQDVRGNSPDRKTETTTHQYNPSHYQDTAPRDTAGYHRKGSTDAVLDLDNELYSDDFPIDHMDAVSEILSEMSNHNERETERTEAMQRLMRLTRDGSVDMWDEHFKTILLLLLETLGDNAAAIRALAMRTLREVLRHQPQRFHDYAELTILKILEAHKDGAREVVRNAEECAATLAASVSPDKAFQVS